MNDTLIEELLRKSPRLTVPQGLEDQLKAGIRLSRKEQAFEIVSPWSLLLKRLIPIAACVIAISVVAVQGVMLHRLRTENEKLNKALQSIESIQTIKQEELEQVRNMGAELARLHKDQLELQQLRKDTESMRREVSDMEQVRAANLQLKNQQIAMTATNVDFFAQQKIEADAALCVNNMKQIGLGARLWVSDHEDKPGAIRGEYPKTFAEFRAEAGDPKVFFCPIDAELRRNATEADIDQGRSSYIFVTPGANENEPDVVITRCPHHGNVGLADGSVQKGVLNRRFKIGKDNKLERK